MATFTAGTSFTDGVTGDVTAAKLNALVANATPLHNLITDRTAETAVASDDLVLISDTSDSGALNKATCENLFRSTGTGTAAAPAVAPSSDTNTGIFFPAADTIALAEGGTEAMRIDSSGNVGIGDTTPEAKLTVKTSTGPSFVCEATNLSQLVLGYNNTSVNYYDADTHIFRNNPASGIERLRITSGGEVYIAGTTDQGAYNLQVNGTGVWGAGAYVNGSDERLKENIQDITSGLDVVEKLRPVSFQYNKEYTADRSVQSGFIAQDLLVALEGKNYLEGVVSQGPTYYNVAYQNLIPILAKAIQELKAENDSLKSRIEALEAA